MPKQMSLRKVPDFAAVCKMPRDNYNVGDWSIMTDGGTVWITRQKLGESAKNRTWAINDALRRVPKRFISL